MSVANLDTGLTKETITGASGLFRIPLLPVGTYSVTADAPQFAMLVRQPIRVNVSETVRMELRLDLATVKTTLSLIAETPLVDTSTNTLGAVVTRREILDLPLTGRNFTQLGLLQRASRGGMNPG